MRPLQNSSNTADAEQLREIFIPLATGELIWDYVDKVLRYCADNRISDTVKLSRAVKTLHAAYTDVGILAYYSALFNCFGEKTFPFSYFTIKPLSLPMLFDKMHGFQTLRTVPLRLPMFILFVIMQIVEKHLLPLLPFVTFCHTSFFPIKLA